MEEENCSYCFAFLKTHFVFVSGLFISIIVNMMFVFDFDKSFNELILNFELSHNILMLLLYFILNTISLLMFYFIGIHAFIKYTVGIITFFTFLFNMYILRSRDVILVYTLVYFFQAMISFFKNEEVLWVSLFLINFVLNYLHTNYYSTMLYILCFWFVSVMGFYGGNKGTQHVFKHFCFLGRTIIHLSIIAWNNENTNVSYIDASLICVILIAFIAGAYTHYYDTMMSHSSELFANIIQVIVYVNTEFIWKGELSTVLITEPLTNIAFLALGMNKYTFDEINFFEKKGICSRLALPIYLSIFLTTYGIRYSILSNDIFKLLIIYVWVLNFIISMGKTKND